jgi:YggT family protein
MDLMRLLLAALNVYQMVIIVRALASWFNPNPYHPLYHFLIQITEPVLNPLRRIIPVSGIDFSPMAAILLIEVIKNLIF